jgi:hypothetical protein
MAAGCLLPLRAAMMCIKRRKRAAAVPREPCAHALRDAGGATSERGAGEARPQRG